MYTLYCFLNGYFTGKNLRFSAREFSVFITYLPAPSLPPSSYVTLFYVNPQSLTLLVKSELAVANLILQYTWCTYAACQSLQRGFLMITNVCMK